MDSAFSGACSKQGLLILCRDAPFAPPAVGGEPGQAYGVTVLPYPNGRVDRYRTVFCLREHTLVRKQPECYTCSWCETGSTTMIPVAGTDPLPALPNSECLMRKKQAAWISHRAA